MSYDLSYKHLLVIKVYIFLPFFLLGPVLWGQSFSSEPTKTNVVVNGNTYPAFESYFEFPADDVTNAFWKYSKAFSHPENNKSYYKLIVPPKDPENEMPLTLFGKPTKNGNTSTFAIGIDLEEMDGDQKTYLNQVKTMMMEFKVDVYMNHFQDQINQLSKEAKKLSKAHQRALKKGKLYAGENANILSRLQSIEKQIGQYRNQQVILLSVLKKVKG